MCDDRTAEFLSLARDLPHDRLQQGRPAASLSTTTTTTTLASSSTGRYGGGGGGGSSAASSISNNNNNPAYTELRNFHRTAADISRDIAATSAMLSELTRLVRQSNSSLFVDDSDRVNALVLRIKANIENLNGRLDQAGATIQQQKYKLGRHSQAGQEATNVVGQLKEEFVQATAGFKRVLQQRTDVMKETSNQKRQVYGASGEEEVHQKNVVRLDNLPPVYASSEHNNINNSALRNRSMMTMPTLDLTSGMTTGEPTSSASQLPRPHGIAGDYTSPAMRLRKSHSDLPIYSGSTSSYHASTTTNYHSGNAAPLTPFDIARMEQESDDPQQQRMQLIPDQDYLRERADAMSTVETNIAELGTIFNKLAVMVSEHREMVQRVEDNVDDTSSNVELSMQVLTDTLTTLRTNRALAAKVFSIIVVFIILFIVFFA